MATISLRNFTSLNVIVYAADGDSVVLPPNSVVEVDDKFDFSLDPNAVRLVTQVTELYTPPSEGGGSGGIPVTPVDNSVLAVIDAGAGYTTITLGENEVIGRLPDGTIGALTITDLPVDVDDVTQVGVLTRGSMTLATLTQTPDADSIRVFFNGMSLNLTEDYTVSYRTVTATAALNEIYGGSSTDGFGFDSSDEVKVIYRPKVD